MMFRVDNYPKIIIQLYTLVPLKCISLKHLIKMYVSVRFQQPFCRRMNT